MYKYRISKWGLRKYLKADETRNIMRKIERGQKTDLPIVQGRQLGSRRFKAKAEQASKLQHVVRDHMLRQHMLCQGLNGQIKAPDILYISESTLFFVRANVSEKISTGQSSYPVPGVRESWNDIDRSSTWWADMRSAANQVIQNRDSASGFAALSNCFARYATQPLEDFPVAWCPYTAMLLLYEIGEDMGKLFGRYMVNLSSLRYGESHPNTRRWAEILKLDAGIRSEAFASIMLAEFNAALETTSPDSPFWLAMTSLALGYSCGQGLISPEAGVARLVEAIGDGGRGDKQHTARQKTLVYPTTSATSALQSAYLHKASSAFTWSDIPLQILLRLSEMNPSIPPENIVDALYFLLGTLDSIDARGSAERYLRSAISFLRQKRPDDCRIELLCTKLEYMQLRQKDEDAEAACFLQSELLSAAPTPGVSTRWLFLSRLG